MSFLFKQPKMPSVVSPVSPAMPTPISAEAELKEKEKKKIRRGTAGRTIATGPLGIAAKAKVERKFLLGE